MGREIPKQFIPIGGRPVLMHTLIRFVDCQHIVLALPAEHIAYWAELCQEYQFDLPHTICHGGATRYHSVRNALELARSLSPSPALVAIHDGVRPFVSTEVIDECFRAAEASGAALPYRPVTDSLRQLDGSGSHAVERSQYIAVQTPQVFDLDQLMSAYGYGFSPAFTDDASVWEAAFPDRGIALVEGNAENIKLTTPIDLLTAEHLLG